MDPNKQITETLKELLAEMNAMKTTIPSSELRIIQLSMEEFKHAQSDMKKDLSDLKKHKKGLLEGVRCTVSV